MPLQASSCCFMKSCILPEQLHFDKGLKIKFTHFLTALGVLLLQVLLLQRICKSMDWAGLEVLTIDKCQGRDKDVVLLSLVRSNEGCNAGKLLRDWRRLNVAITRAKKKLVIIGSGRTLSTIPHLADLLKLMSSKQWCVMLPPVQV